MRLFGLIGYPLAQSFSKKYFDEKFAKEGLDNCSFQNFPIASLDALPELLAAQPGLEGLAVTIPYKQAVLPYLDASRIPPGLNACNCIRIREGKLTGFNTDYIGFEKSFASLLQPHHDRALVLGNGGATAAVIYVLGKLKIPFEIVSRELHDGSTLTYAGLDENVMRRHSIIINTTPLGMYPHADTCPDIPYAYLTGQHLLYDLVYNPDPTRFLRHGQQAGAVTKNGADMLVFQAEENWKIWNS